MRHGGAGLARSMKALVYTDFGSADLLQHALQQRPDYPEAHYRLARAYSHLGRRDDAQKEVALQQKFADDAKAAEQRRMKEVTTFLITAN